MFSKHSQLREEPYIVQHIFIVWKRTLHSRAHNLRLESFFLTQLSTYSQLRNLTQLSTHSKFKQVHLFKFQHRFKAWEEPYIIQHILTTQSSEAPYKSPKRNSQSAWCQLTPPGTISWLRYKREIVSSASPARAKNGGDKTRNYSSPASLPHVSAITYCKFTFKLISVCENQFVLIGNVLGNFAISVGEQERSETVESPLQKPGTGPNRPDKQ